MKKHIIYLLGSIVFPLAMERQNDIKTVIATTVKTEEPVQGERTKGITEVRDTVNGTVLFTLYDNVLIESTLAKDNWVQIGLFPDNPESDYENYTLKKGVKIKVDGKIIGETKQPVELSLGIVGYIPKNHIQSKTIVENAFENYLIKNENSRKLKDCQQFISNFKLEKDTQFEGLEVYYNYENWMEDPSPIIRYALVFQNNTLVAILHSRPINTSKGTDYKIDNRLSCFVFNDVAQAEHIVKTFSQFTSAVD
ncbi:conserved hypothetical protein [Flavobacterium sp. 9AF]|uniref:hypothetical protein n=1 Tax=Flavobacterium sp. 9AF TaxID=2653142 RepID=UPI0012EF9E53|nr:hypothetical protein [Flavobacterium sp. 9AF]VXB58303.1 conserved hypothetical protein [Flavobacterium sp. 9AF]